MLISTQNFTQLSVTMKKLCHIKHDHLVNFYISLQKTITPENPGISATVWPISTKFAERASLAHRRLTILSLKSQDGRRMIHLKDPFS